MGGSGLLTSEFILILLWIGAVAVLTRFIRFDHVEIIAGRRETRYSWLFAFAVFFPVIWMAGHRGYIGDTGVYIRTFVEMPEDFNGFVGYLNPDAKDWAFFALSCLIKVLFGDNPTRYFMIIAFLQGVILLSVFRKYSPDYLVSVFLFLASADYISWMFNGIRQFTAVTIILAGTGWMIRKKHIRVILLILLASQFHKSALLMIPIYLIAQGKAWNVRTMLFMALVILAVVYVQRFTNILDDLLAETQYSNVVSEYQSFHDDGTSPIRVLVYSVPALFAFIGRRKIIQVNNPLINLSTNMALISAGLYIISAFTSGIFLGRLPIFASIFGYILLPWEIDYLYKDNSRIIVYFLMIIFYLLFYYYQMHMAWGLF